MILSKCRVKTKSKGIDNDQLIQEYSTNRAATAGRMIQFGDRLEKNTRAGDNIGLLAVGVPKTILILFVTYETPL